MVPATASMSVSRVLLLEVLVEAGIILAALLLGCSRWRKAHPRLRQPLAGAAEHRRTSLEERPALLAEVAVLVAEGWLHWRPLNAGAAIAARAAPTGR